jgi:hypothetical protein
MAPARTRFALLAVVAAVWGWWATGLEPFSTQATVVVLGSGLVAMATGGARRADASSLDIPRRAATPWVVLLGALVAWQLAAYFQHPRSDHPTLSSLTNTALDPRPVRLLAFAAWTLAAGWLARR